MKKQRRLANLAFPKAPAALASTELRAVRGGCGTRTIEPCWAEPCWVQPCWRLKTTTTR